MSWACPECGFVSDEYEPSRWVVRHTGTCKSIGIPVRHNTPAPAKAASVSMREDLGEHVYKRLYAAGGALVPFKDQSVTIRFECLTAVDAVLGGLMSPSMLWRLGDHALTGSSTLPNDRHSGVDRYLVHPIRAIIEGK